MLIEILKIQKFDSKNRRRTQKICVYKCDGDNCCNYFVNQYHASYVTGFRFCCKYCHSNCLLLKQNIKITRKERSNKDFKIKKCVLSQEKKDEINRKRKLTCIEKYGVDHPWKLKEIHDKGIETFKLNHGTGGVLGSTTLRKNYEKTMLKNHGYEHPSLSPKIKDKKRKTCIEKYGVDHPHKTQEVLDKVKETTFKHYGVDCIFKSEKIKQNIDYIEINRKRINTLQKQNKLWTSKPEILLGNWLKQTFGEHDILQQVWINEQSIDFLIKSLKLYIQLDGVYWHGLTQKSVKKFHNKVLKDQLLNDWFENNTTNLKLFRISDLQWLKIINDNEYNLVLEQINNTIANVMFFEYNKIKYRLF